MQTAPIIAVDPNARTDEHYRYKMPGILIKIEGNGNGIKTVFPNIVDVCNSIHRSESFLLKYLGVELGAQSTEQTISANVAKYLVMGKFEKDRIQQKVDEFICKYVLCQHCRNPETEIKVGKSCYMTCKACQRESKISSGDKMIKQIQTLPNNGNKTDKKGATAAGTKAADAAANISQDVAGGSVIGSAPAPASSGSSKKIAEEATEAIKKGFLSHDTNSVIEQRIFDYKLQMSDKDVIKSIVFAIWDYASEKSQQGMFFAALISRVELLRKFCETESHQDAVIRCVEKLGWKRDTAFKFPIALKILYDENVLSDVAIIKWFETAKPPKDERELQVHLLFKEKCKPLIAWLTDQPIID